MNSIADQLVEAYNAQDAHAFAALFAVEAVVYEHPNRLAQRGREAILKYYQKLFANYPANQTKVLHRIVVGNRIIDHERVQRSLQHAPFEVVTIYEVSNGLIGRIDFVRKSEEVINY